MKIFLSFIINIVFFCGYLGANPRVLMKHYTTENGLANNNVNCLIKDKDGFFWFGTWYGLCRYDGYTYKKYNETDYPLLNMAPRKIHMLLEDKNGILWIKTIDGKLYTFNKKTEQFHFLNDEMKNMSGYTQVIKIQKNRSGNILVLTKDKNLFEASSDESGHFDIRLECEVNRNQLNHKWQLKENILSESETHICWIGKDYNVVSIEKKDKGSDTKTKYILSEILNDSTQRFTSIFQSEELLWIGDDRGNIMSVNLGTGIVSKFILPQVSNTIESLFYVKGKLYFSVKKQGVFSYNISSKKIQKCINLSSDEKVASIYMDSSNMLWFNTSRSLYICNILDGTVISFPWNGKSFFDGMKVKNWDKQYKFLLTPDGEAWMIDVLNGTRCYISELEGAEEISENQTFTDLYIDSEDGVLITTPNNGVYSLQFQGNSFKFIKSMDFSERTNDSDLGGIRALCQTKNGNIWIGTRKKALYLLDSDGDLLQSYYAKDYDWVGSIYHILEDSKGNIWMSSKGYGLIKAVADNSQNTNFRFYKYTHSETHPYSISSNDVYLTYEDSNGRLWIGTFGGGLNLLNENNGKTPLFYNIYNDFLDYPKFGQYREIRTLVEDSKGRLWIGTTDGLMSLNGDFLQVEKIDFETYRSNITSGITENDVYVLYKDNSSMIWGSVFGGGLLSLNSYDEDKHLPQFVLYGEKDGVNNNVVLGITEDLNGNVWFTTERGVSSYNRKTKKFSSFDNFDGFPEVDIEENVIMHTQQNEIWVGTKDGLIKFNPKETYSHKLTSPTYIVDFKVANNSLKVGSDVPVSIPYSDVFELRHDQSMFTIEFATLNYVGRSRVNYKYKLKGYEDNWHFTGPNRIASYTNVPPGKYVFVVEAIDHTDSSFISDRKISIVVLPPWWATWWAYSIYIVIIILLLYFSIRFSISFMKMKNNIYVEQKLTELKIKFFTNVSHELRTPLTLMSGPIHELKEKEALSEKGEKYVEMMERSIQQMLQLVNQILDFRKIQNGKMRLHVSFVDLSSFLSSVCNEFHVIAMENDISFIIQPIDSSIKLWVDEEKFGIVIRNILSNAFKYTPQGGRIVVNAKIDNDNKCTISISDSGVGIQADKLEEIFERFSQAENNSGIPYKGTGIGLALSKELVNMHHGTIYAESDGKNGAIFSVTIPLGKKHFSDYEVDFYVGDLLEVETKAQISADENILVNDEDVDSSRPTILLVEDNKDLCIMLRMQLEEVFNIFIASNGIEGLQKIDKVHPDLIITDQMMPQMDGMEMLQNIKNNFETSHIPVIMLTALSGDDIKQKAYSIGANAYISKPFSKDFLMIRIRQLLDERKRFIAQFYQPLDTQSKETCDSENQLYEKKDVELLKKVRMIIEENLDNPDFNIDSIAQSLGLSRSAFFKKLKSILGIAPVELIKEIRLNKAEHLIKTTDMSVSEIAYAVGFRDAGYFSKCFRSKYNQSPRDFISQDKNN